MAGNEAPSKPAKATQSDKPANIPANLPANIPSGKSPATAKAPSAGPAATKPAATKPAEVAKAQDQDDFKYRILKPVGRDRYESPAGLIYAPGSEEGHRLAHIARHLEDQPERPGSHGVFDGDMAAFLVAIDDAYKRARGHAKGTKSRLEDGMTVYEAPFDQAIGYLGGTEGARKKNPKLKKLRLVLRDRNLITAFPIQ
jgi:hypothetical protein